MVLQSFALPLSGPIAPESDGRRHPLVVLALHSWVVLVAILPLLILHGIPDSALNTLYEHPFGHALLEGFCGLTALMIAATLCFLGARQKDASLLLFALAFFAMGALDMVHATTDPAEHHERFYLLHTASTVAGALLLSCGAILKWLQVPQSLSPLSSIPARNLILAALSVLGLAAGYQITLAHFAETSARLLYQFPDPVHRAHDVAAILYALSAMAFYAYYCSRKHIPALIIGSLLMLFAEAAYLFQFSTMWSITWWMWHAIKVVIYFSIFLTIDVSSLLALVEIESSHSELTRTNARLRESEGAMRAANHELRVRNEMIASAMNSLDLNNVLVALASAARQLVGHASFDLVLRVPGDEVEEFNDQISPSPERNRVIGTPADVPCPVHCFGPALAGAANDASPCDSFHCYPLTADEEEIGQLRVRLSGDSRDSRELDLLSALAAEAGPLVYNALLHHRQLEHEQFRAGILRISLALGRVANLEEVLKVVHEESAPLLRADAAILWLLPEGPGEPGPNVRFEGRLPFDPASLENPGALGMLAAGLLRQHDGRYRPIALASNDAGAQEMRRWLADGGFECGALAAFPLVQDHGLVGVLAFVRLGHVAFSARTLGKGELLTGVIQAAINNVRSQSRLTDLNEQLVHAEETRVRSERLAALGEMAASVAHELRNPLGAINNCLGVLRRIDCGSDASASAALEIIEDEVRRLDKLARDFLIFGCHKPVALKPVLVGTLLDRVWAAVEHYIVHEKLNVAIKARYLGANEPILFDADALEIVLWNLTLNAVQSTRENGRVDVTIRVRGQRLLLVVADNGIGISREDLAKIFRPFFSRRAHGAGLGLSIVQRYCQDWRGQIRAISRFGHGTVFALRVPLAGAAACETANPSHELLAQS